MHRIDHCLSLTECMELLPQLEVLNVSSKLNASYLPLTVMRAPTEMLLSED